MIDHTRRDSFILLILTITAGLALCGNPAVAAGEAELLFEEDFDSLPLGPSVEEAIPRDAVWTKTPPPGWTIDDSGVPGVGTSLDGMTEWAGWSFTDPAWWTATAGGQRRSEFTNADGAIAVADPDEWDDGPHVDSAANGWYETYLSTPPIPIGDDIVENSARLTFD